MKNMQLEETFPPKVPAIPATASPPYSTLRGKSLPANVMFAIFGNAWYALCFWGMLILTAKMSDSAMVGRVSLGFSIATPALLFAALQTRAIQVSDRTSGYRLVDFLYLRIATTVLVAVPVGLVVAFKGKLGLDSDIILLAIWYRSIENIADVFHGVFQSDERMDRIAWSQVLRGGATVVILALVLRSGGDFLLAFACTTFAPLLVVLFYDIPCTIGRQEILIARKAYLAVPSRARMFELAGLGIPLGAAAVLISVSNNVPRYAVAGIQGNSALGGFSAVIYLVVAGSLFIDALNQSALPALSREFTRGNRRAFAKILGWLCAIAAGLSVTGLLIATTFGGAILRLLYRPEYGTFSTVLSWCCVGFFFQSLGSTLRCGLIAARQYRVQFPLLLMVTAVSALSAVSLTLLFGVNGAAISLIASGLALAAGAGFLLVRHVWRMSPEAVA